MMAIMKRLLLVTVALLVVAGVGAAGFVAGSNSRDDEIASLDQKVASLNKRTSSLNKEVESWKAREVQLKLREARAPKLPAGAFPKGYPKVVPVAKVPAQMRDEASGDEVVAVAPGVWADLAPGTDIADAATATLFGYCSSIKAYERMYTPGNEHSNSCW
jgi:hypothetical protein